MIFRNTPQWFVYMDKELGGFGVTSPSRGDVAPKARVGAVGSRLTPTRPASARRHLPLKGGVTTPDTLRTRALAAIDATRFVPAGGQTRLRAMIAERPDWVLSRQRAWGVPICVFADDNGEVLNDEAVNARIIEAFEQEGADAWFAEGARERFLGSRANEPWTMVKDILDVWFDSGSTHTFTLEDRPDLKWPADVYLEGSDQHRGWFHSSLLESCGTRGRAPYDTVVTHGFTMDEEGRKMSKSLGNTVVPQDVMKQSGADILRLWVMTTDYWEDQRLGKNVLQTNIDAYRKLRNTMRWMLGTLAHDEGDECRRSADMPELERLMLHRLSELDELVRAGYDAFDFKRITKALLDFMVVDLSAFYFDIRKDALYCDAPSSKRRLAAVQVVRHLFDHLATWLAPMLPFTTEEAWLERYPDTRSIHLRAVPRRSGGMARRSAGRKVAENQARARRRYRGAGDRAGEEGDRLVAGGGADGVHRRCRPAARRSRTSTSPKSRSPAASKCRTRRAGGRLPAGRCGGRCGRPEPRGGHEMRALLALHRRCRFRSGLPGCLGARCGGAARTARTGQNW